MINQIARKSLYLICAMVLAGQSVGVAEAHHVLGRPAYSLNEDSNTPPSLQGEAEIGDYFITYMVFPAFPKPNEPGRVNLYVKRLTDNKSFDGKIAFKIRNESRLSLLGAGGEGELIGVQASDDKVFRQGFLFKEAGDFVMSAEFSAGGEPYRLDFPVRIGEPSPFGTFGIAVGSLLVLLLTVTVVQRRRAMTGKVRAQHHLSAVK